MVVLLPEELDGWLVLVCDFCLLLVPWFIVEDEFTSVDVWLALVELLVVFEPLPTFTPGLMLAAALRSVFETPTFALTPTFGFTLSEEDELDGLLDELVLDGLLEDDVPDGLLEDDELDGLPELLVPEVPAPLVPEALVPDDDVPDDEVPLPLSEPELLRFVVPEL